VRDESISLPRHDHLSFSGMDSQSRDPGMVIRPK